MKNVTLVLGGEERRLTFDFNRVCEVEKLTGINLLAAATRPLKAEELRAMLFASLEKSSSLEELGSLIHPHNAATIHEAIIAVWFGEDPGEQE